MGGVSACKPSAVFVGLQEALRNTGIRLVCDKLTSMSTPQSNPAGGSSRHSFADTAFEAGTEADRDAAEQQAAERAVAEQMRDIAEVAAVEVITTTAVHLMSAAAVKCGLAEGPDAEDLKDLDEARKLITALAGLVTAAAPEIGSQHAGPLRDGLRSLQLAFREASVIQDAPGKGPGEKFTGPVN